MVTSAERSIDEPQAEQNRPVSTQGGAQDGQVAMYGFRSPQGYPRSAGRSTTSEIVLRRFPDGGSWPGVALWAGPGRSSSTRRLSPRRSRSARLPPRDWHDQASGSGARPGGAGGGTEAPASGAPRDRIVAAERGRRQVPGQEGDGGSRAGRRRRARRRPRRAGGGGEAPLRRGRGLAREPPGPRGQRSMAGDVRGRSPRVASLLRGGLGGSVRHVAQGSRGPRGSRTGRLRRA